MIRIGCHLSPSKGLLAMGRDALSIRANTFQFFLIQKQVFSAGTGLVQVDSGEDPLFGELSV